MRKTNIHKSTFGALAAAALVLATGPVARAQIYSNTVIGLNPVGYWPLNEAVAPPEPLNLTAVNLGTLGPAGNGHYGAWYQPWGNTWYITNNIVQAPAVTAPYDGSVGMVCQEAPGQYVIVPRNTNGVANPSLALNPPFSIEAWLQIGTTGSALGSIVSQGGTVNLNTGGPNTNNPYYGGLGTGWAGVELGQYQDYLFLLTQATNASGNKASELDTSSYNTFTGFKVGQWVHVVATFDGSIEQIYTNGVLCASKNSPANAIGQQYVTDPTTPLMIGAGSDVTAVYGQAYHGTIDDVAIYNQVLPASSVQNHYQAAYGNFTTFTSYTNAVLADSPVLYYRLNDPQTQVNAGYPSGTFPVAKNYGSAGAAANGVYQPGTTPGAAGPAYAGFGANSKAVALNGYFGAVDVGGSNLPASLNPTGAVPLSVVTWFRGGPADAPGRFQEMLGHGDSSYRLALGQAAGENHFNPGPGPELQFTSPQDVASNGFALNDGNWHMAAGVSDGTNDYLYLDGVLAKSASNATGIKIVGNPADLLIGGDSEYTVASPTAVNTIRTFDGQVAQVAFWTSALTAQQIQSLYNAAEVPPYIWQEPLGPIAVSGGQNVSVPVSARGSSLTYQWYQNGSPVSGQTSATLTFTPAQTGNAGNYFVVVKNNFGSVTSSIVALTVYGPPTVEAQTPTPLKIFGGASPTLHVTALGAQPIHYQWTLAGSAIAGATNSSYTVTNIQASGTYGCSLSNVAGNGAIAPIAITVLADPTAPYPAKVLADGPVAYFRLDEASGTTAYDYVGGDNATYTNVLLGVPGYNPVSDPNETAAQFGADNPPNNYAGNVPPYLNFGTPSGGNAEFSVEAWMTETFPYVNGNAIVALGYGNGGEQFVLDTGNNTAGDLRFFVRNAAGTVSSAGSTAFLENDGLWHHVVGVCDEAGGNVYLYLDGNEVASASITPGSGLLASTTPLSIGARQSGNNGNTNYDLQFYGSIDDVAVYNKALSASQVLGHYGQSGIAPIITGLQPSSNWTTNQGANVIVSVSVEGTTPLTYQWLDTLGNPIPWATAATITLTNVQPSAAGTYTVNVSNPYGGPVSTNFTLSETQIPEIIADITPTNAVVYDTEPVTLSVAAVGTPPLHYQWYQNGTAIPGATSTTYTFPALLGTNRYYLAVTNIYSAGTPTLSSTATVVGMPSSSLNPSNYTDNLKITIAGYNRSETLNDFPLLVRLGTNLAGFDYSHFASPTGGDLRFTDASGTRTIPFEIDQWNPDGQSVVWVQVPALSGTNTTIWAYWGDPSAATPPSGTNVWVPQPWENLPAYDVVYHLKESGFPYLDSTGQYPADTGVAPSPVAGVVGTGELFNNAAYLDAGSVNLGETFSLSAWVNVSSAVANIQGIWANGPGGYATAEVVLFVNDYNTDDGVLELGTGNGTAGTQFSTATGAVSFNQWHFVTATLDRGAGTALLYVDGSLEASGSVRTDFPTNSDMQLGRFTAGAFALNGDMDEARIHGGVESSNWVWTSWMTVQENANLETYSAIASTATNLPTAVNIRAKLANGSLTLSGSGGPDGGTYYVLGSTNLLTPPAEWQVVSTNFFDGSGNFSVAIPVEAATRTEFFRIKE
ncbi:MAG: DUF2341 domain-containing protein [Verrucomicrobiota bacterium]